MDASNWKVPLEIISLDYGMETKLINRKSVIFAPLHNQEQKCYMNTKNPLNLC